jgi:X-X-X-Leu-X-X-Gly heptad repeat protein
MPFGQVRTPLEPGAEVLGDVLPKLEDGVPKLEDGLSKLGEGLPKLGDGLLKLGEGVLKLGEGVLKLGDGLPKPGDGELGRGASGVMPLKLGTGLSVDPGVGLKPGVAPGAVAPPLLGAPEVWAKTAALERTPSATAAARGNRVVASMLESPLL